MDKEMGTYEDIPATRNRASFEIVCHVVSKKGPGEAMMGCERGRRSGRTDGDGEEGDGEEEEESEEQDEVVSGVGWRMVKRDETTEQPKFVGLQEAIERYGKKRSHRSEVMMEGVEESASNSPPPRKKPSKITLFQKFNDRKVKNFENNTPYTHTQ